MLLHILSARMWFQFCAFIPISRTSLHPFLELNVFLATGTALYDRIFTDFVLILSCPCDCLGCDGMWFYVLPVYFYTSCFWIKINHVRFIYTFLFCTRCSTGSSATPDTTYNYHVSLYHLYFCCLCCVLGYRHLEINSSYVYARITRSFWQFTAVKG